MPDPRTLVPLTPLASAAAPAAAEATVNMTDGQGGTFAVPASQVANAARQGWAEETPEQFAARDTRRVLASDPLIAVGTAAAGALRGATFGLSDLALTAGSGPAGEAETYGALEGMRAAHPTLALGSEIVGGLAPALASGGASLAPSAARAGASVGSRIAGAAGRAALQGAVEGAVYGAASSVTREIGEERILSDPGGSATRILADVGLYGLLGGALGGAAGGAAKAAGEAGSALGSMAVRRVAGELPAGATATEAAGIIADREARAAIAGRAGASLDDGVGTRLMREGVDVSTPERALEGVKRLADDATERMAAIVKDADVRVDLDAVAQRVDELVARADPATQSTDVARTIKRATAPLRELQAATAKSPDRTVTAARLVKLQRDMRSAGAQLQKAGKRALSADAKQALIDVRDTLESAVGEVLDAASPAPVDPTGFGGAITTGGVKPNAAGKLTRAPGETASAAYQRARADAALYLKVQQAAERHAAAQSGAGGNTLARALDSGMTGAAVVGAMTHPAALLGIAAPAVVRAAQQRGAGIAARVAYAASRGDMRLGQIADRLLRKPALALGRVASRAPSVAARAGGDSWLARYHAAVEPVEEFRRDPKATVARLSEAVAPITETHPELAASLVEQGLAAISALAKRAPPTLDRPTLTPHLAQRAVSPEAARDFVRAAEAMADPEAAIEAIDRGDATWLDLQALREGQPALWSAIREAMVERLPTLAQELPFERAVTLGVAFDLPGAEYSLDPAIGASLQAAQAPPDGVADQRPPRPPRSGPTQSARWAGQMQLAGDRIAGRRG